jgi:Zinc finger, C3HC4 type (RING finger)
VLPVPFPVPATYKVTFSQGAVIRSDIDLSSPVIGHAPQGTVLTVTGRVFSERSTHKCIARYRLAGNGGWISARLNLAPPHDEAVVKFVGASSAFDPDQAGMFHLSAMRSILSEQPPIAETLSDRELTASSTAEQGAANENGLHTATTDTATSAEIALNISFESPRPSPTCVYSVPVQPVKQRRKSPPDNHCSICLCEDRTATIIHGETGHIVCCLVCARILKARGDPCPVCRLPIDLVVQHFWA